MDTMEGESAQTLRELDRRRRQEASRADAEAERIAPKHVSQAIVGAVNRLADNLRPEQLKSALINQIMSRKYPGLDRAVAGRAADAVVFDGLPRKELDRVLREVDRARAQDKAKNPGGLFNHKIQKACKDHRVRWRDGKSSKHQDGQP